MPNNWRMDSIELDGYTWWRVTPLAEVPRARYGKFLFNPLVWGMGLSLWTIALWLALDLLFQVFVTFRRWGGLYFWTVLCTSFGVGVHASLLLVKGYTVLSVAEDIGTTVLIKLGDIMTQTGFSLVLYSRLNLVLRSWDPMYLKWILISILATSFLVHTPVIICTFGVNVPPPTRLKWLARVRIAERVVILYFTMQELALSTFYTWTTASLVKSQLHSNSLRHQPAKTRRNLFIFMLFAQAVTFFADLSMVILAYMDLFHFKVILHPFFYGVKLKVEFMALDQLQSLVQPNVSMFVFTGDTSPANPSHQHAASGSVSERGGIKSRILAPETNPPYCPRCKLSTDGSPSSDSKESGSAAVPEHSNAPICQGLSQGSRVQITRVDSPIDGSIADLERQYLGRDST